MRAQVGRLCSLSFASSLLMTTACGHPPEPVAGSRAARSEGASSAAAPAAQAAQVVPVPETLALVAGQFGLTMQPESFTWKVLRRNVTRFDWEGRPRDALGDREVLYSFYAEKLDDNLTKVLPQIVGTVAANLTEGEPCRPFEQPAQIVKLLGVDRVITVCFEPSTFYGKEHHQGVLHGLVKNRALTIVVVLGNDRRAALPLPEMIGARGAN
ncbi:MAG: hypothetical protein JWO86_5616 [Myxococcaceae bacterium]|nr:hypothetical protein [Myxococcaceae bacterium]